MKINYKYNLSGHCIHQLQREIVGTTEKTLRNNRQQRKSHGAKHLYVMTNGG